MESQQIMELLLAIREEINASRKKMIEKMEANRKADHEEMMTMMETWGETLDAWSKDTKDNGEETMACQETMEARLEEEKAA
jgi:hypothetical protein